MSDLDGPYVFPLLRRYRDFYEEGMDNLPACYILCDKSDTPLYIGRSKNVISRIVAHWIDQRDGNGHQWRLAGGTEWYIPKPFAPPDSTIRIWYCDGIEILEKKLISYMKPKFNTHKYEYVR
jgi:hypothetical protein